jgi:aryl-alcohol dehydrogenase-like predicted oxidoreductase
VGDALKRYTSRDQIVLATKLYLPMSDTPGGRGLSRRAIMEQIDASLDRLDTDYVDLYQIHRFDPTTPIEETMEALHDVVKSGKARYIGASSMWAWQFGAMQYAADSHGWTRFISMQDQYSLIHREEEREMFGLLASQGVGSIPWSPLGMGRVARPWAEASTTRGGMIPDADPAGRPLYLESDKAIVDAVQRIAEARGVSMAEIGMAWVLKNPVVTAPIVGPTKPEHLNAAVRSLEIELSEDEVNALEAPYVPRLPTWFSPGPDEVSQR